MTDDGPLEESKHVALFTITTKDCYVRRNKYTNIEKYNNFARLGL